MGEVEEIREDVTVTRSGAARRGAAAAGNAGSATAVDHGSESSTSSVFVRAPRVSTPLQVVTQRAIEQVG
jgi:hypothetical protein